MQTCGRIFFGLALSLGLLLPASTLAVRAAEQPTQLIGDTTGDAFTARCDDGTAIVGFTYNADHQLKAIAPLCRAVEGEGLASGKVIKAKSVKGAEGGAGHDPLACKNDQTVRSLRVTLNATNGFVQSFRATCSGPGAASLLLPPTVANGEVAPGSAISTKCPGRSYAVAVTGTFKAVGIRSIGLICQSVDDVQAEAEDTGPAPDDEGDDRDGPGIEFNIEVGGGGGGDDELRFATEPTTIYARPAGKEIGYLEQGDTVSIVECRDGGKGWCEISAPVEGFVWGSDFN